MWEVILAVGCIALIIYSFTDKGQMRDGGSKGGSSASNSSTSTPTKSSTPSDKKD